MFISTLTSNYIHNEKKYNNDHLDHLGHILVQACSHARAQGSLPSRLHPVGPIHLDHTPMDITHPLAHLEGLDASQEHHPHTLDTTMGTTRIINIMSHGSHHRHHKHHGKKHSRNSSSSSSDSD
ncbi:UNVERIFIED_CONTAM: hypothetical protein K2H54_043303 [Gekko kuhli]